jgi:hypothetical protein
MIITMELDVVEYLWNNIEGLIDVMTMMEKGKEGHEADERVCGMQW